MRNRLMSFPALTTPHSSAISTAARYCACVYFFFLVTNNKKDVYNQMKVNGKVEMCGMNKGTWIRVKGAVKEDTRREARVAMMEANKNALQSMYTVDDNLMTVFVFESVIATIYSFTEEPKVINL